MRGSRFIPLPLKMEKQEFMMIETKRLKIYPATQDQMQMYISSETDEGLKMAYTEMLEGCLRNPSQWEWYAMWMIERKDRKHVGNLCFKGLDINGVTEIGYGIRDDYQGQGYATEAVNAAVAWAFQHQEVMLIVAETDHGNTASQRVLENCGFKYGRMGDEGPRFILSR